MISVSQSTKGGSVVSKEEGFEIIAKILDLSLKDDNYYNGLFRKFRTLTGVNLNIKKLAGYLRVKDGTDYIGPVTLIRVSYSTQHAPLVTNEISDFEKAPASKSGKTSKKVRTEPQGLRKCLTSVQKRK